MEARTAGDAALSGRIATIAIVGRDAPLWITAAAIQRSLGHLGITVRAIELPSLLQPMDVYSAMPAIQGLHKQIGLNDELVVATAKAVPLVAQRYSNWAGASPPWMVGYDEPPPPGSDVGFVHYWVRGRQAGLKPAFEDFSLAASAAKHARVPVYHEESELSAAYGYNLAALPYSLLLKAHANRMGVRAEPAPVGEIEANGDRIAAIALSSGDRIEADLFIDASGVEGALIGLLPGSGFESWDEWLPCDRMVVASGAAIDPPPVYSQISAFRAGWVGLYPLQDRTAVIAAYSSKHISQAEIIDSLPLLARIQIAGDAVASTLRRGVRSRSWIGNCVAIGEAAIGLDPLESLGLYVTHSCISHLMALFPVETDFFPEADRYSREIALAAQNLRDIQCAHYALNRRFDEPFWDQWRDRTPPKSLERKLEVFALTAHVPLYDEEPFEEQQWAALLSGAGILPKRYDPRIDVAPDEALIQKVQQRLRDIAVTVPNMPSAAEFLKRGREKLEVAK
jgi:tryptophan halogenase